MRLLDNTDPSMLLITVSHLPRVILSGDVPIEVRNLIRLINVDDLTVPQDDFADDNNVAIKQGRG